MIESIDHIAVVLVICGSIALAVLVLLIPLAGIYNRLRLNEFVAAMDGRIVLQPSMFNPFGFALSDDGDRFLVTGHYGFAWLGERRSHDAPPLFHRVRIPGLGYQLRFHENPPNIENYWKFYIWDKNTLDIIDKFTLSPEDLVARNAPQDNGREIREHEKFNSPSIAYPLEPGAFPKTRNERKAFTEFLASNFRMPPHSRDMSATEKRYFIENAIGDHIVNRLMDKPFPFKSLQSSCIVQEDFYPFIEAAFAENGTIYRSRSTVLNMLPRILSAAGTRLQSM